MEAGRIFLWPHMFAVHKSVCRRSLASSCLRLSGWIFEQNLVIYSIYFFSFRLVERVHESWLNKINFGKLSEFPIVVHFCWSRFELLLPLKKCLTSQTWVKWLNFLQWGKVTRNPNLHSNSFTSATGQDMRKDDNSKWYFALFEITNAEMRLDVHSLSPAIRNHV